jgi:hypothetical protein
MTESDIDDGKEWSAADRQDLKLAAATADTLAEACRFLCRMGTWDEVAVKAEELGLTFWFGDGDGPSSYPPRRR